MKSIQGILRLLVLVGSVTGFLGGWAMIAHAGKPAPAPAPANVDISVPDALPPLQFNQPSSLQPIQPLQPLPQTSLPRFRTRGS